MKRNKPVSLIIREKFSQIIMIYYNNVVTSISLGYEDYYSLISEPTLNYYHFANLRDGKKFDGVPINVLNRKNYIKVNIKRNAKPYTPIEKLYNLR